MSASILPFRLRRRALPQGIDPAFAEIVAGVMANREASSDLLAEMKAETFVRMNSLRHLQLERYHTAGQAKRIVDLQLDGATLAEAVHSVLPRTVEPGYPEGDG